jgi:hypothetical protein
MQRGDLFLYPGFIRYRATKEAFSVIAFHDVKTTTASVNFQEVDGVPSDSRTIGQTWVKANKDGSRDRRFTNNYQIPIAMYGLLVLKTDSGLWEEFQFLKSRADGPICEGVEHLCFLLCKTDHQLNLTAELRFRKCLANDATLSILPIIELRPFLDSNCNHLLERGFPLRDSKQIVGSLLLSMGLSGGLWVVLPNRLQPSRRHS